MGVVFARVWSAWLVLSGACLPALAATHEPDFDPALIPLRAVPESPALLEVLSPLAAASPDGNPCTLLAECARGEARVLSLVRVSGRLPPQIRPFRLLI